MTPQPPQTPHRKPLGTLLWSPSLRNAIVSAARASSPEEACGLLVGRAFPNGSVVFRVESARNVAEGDRSQRFEVSPEDYFRIDREARNAGLEVVGTWHSHPKSPAVPSKRDLEAAWEGLSHLIVSLLEIPGVGGPSVRSWRLQGETLLEEQLVEQPLP